MPRIEKQVVVANKKGIHARPAALFVQMADRFNSTVTIAKGEEQVNGKSIMGLMMLAAGQGSKLQLICEGSDADKVLADIEALILAKFDEE